jgi:hypothetical protein
MIHITSFSDAKIKDISKEKQLSIANTSPRWWKGSTTLYILTPGSIAWDYKKGSIHEKEYYYMYFNKLQRIMDQFDWNSLEGQYLLCWEPAGKFCHRIILAFFLTLLGYQVELDGKVYTTPEEINIPGVDPLTWKEKR